MGNSESQQEESKINFWEDEGPVRFSEKKWFKSDLVNEKSAAFQVPA